MLENKRRRIGWQVTVVGKLAKELSRMLDNRRQEYRGGIRDVKINKSRNGKDGIPWKTVK